MAGYGPTPAYQTGPDGNPNHPICHQDGDENGVPAFCAKVNALVGVFVGPMGKQIFLIGSSATVTVPGDAVQLFLGIMDGYGWYDNSGAFTVQITPPARPTIQISRVTASDTGVLSGGELPFCSADTIHCEATTASADGLTVDWKVEPESPLVGFLPVFGGAQDALDFTLDVSLLPWMDPYDARPASTLGFLLIARLMDGNVEKTRDSVHIGQSDRGQLRQEYVDHGVSVPAIGGFVPYPHGLDNWNTGNYDWAILGWARSAYARISAVYNRTDYALTVSSVYRNPVANSRLNLGRAKRIASASSLHQYGEAIDFQV